MTIDNIIKIVCQEYELSPEMIQLPTKAQPIIEARQVCHFLAKNNTKYSYKSIGAYIGNKDHATVIHSVKTINILVENEFDLREALKKLQVKIDELTGRCKLTMKTYHERKLICLQ